AADIDKLIVRRASRQQRIRTGWTRCPRWAGWPRRPLRPRRAGWPRHRDRVRLVDPRGPARAVPLPLPVNLAKRRVVGKIQCHLLAPVYPGAVDIAELQPGTGAIGIGRL